ncbi:MAG TPA: DUF4389 domain-containing protein [Gaiella sp.]|jgi:uncharacterized protein DUF4389|nr:DUF4389 domain-containing protein [Gaiella sp.]
MSETVSAVDVPSPHPIHLVVNDDLERNRLTVFFRLILAIPHFIFWALWSLAVSLVVIVAWVVGIFAGRIPDALHSFMAGYVRYSTHLYAYIGIVADPYPGFSGAPGYPIELEVAPAESQSRLTILFRIILAIPAAIVANVLQNVAGIVAILAWFYALFTGKANKGMRDLQAYCLRYQAQTHGYLLLLTQRYPSFSDD